MKVRKNNKKAVWTKEPIMLGLEPARKPKQNDSLSGVVRVLDRKGSGYAFIKFGDGAPASIGKYMPYGVGPQSPCYLKVVESLDGSLWKVYCIYIDEPLRILLWETQEGVSWVVNVRRGKSSAITKKASGQEIT